MKNANTDIELADQILRNFSRLTGVKAGFWKLEDRPPYTIVEGRVRFESAGGKIDVAASLVEDIRYPDFSDLIIRRDINGKLLLLAKTIQPRLRGDLQQIAVNYIDGYGNAFIKLGSVFIWIDGRKEEIPDGLGTSPFSKAGLKIIFQLLTHNGLINKPSREIELRASVSSTPVHQTLRRLKELEYLLTGNRLSLVWNPGKKIQFRWTTEYNRYLRPGLLWGRFSLPDGALWKDLNLTGIGAKWGGQTAAEFLLGKEMDPEKLVIYVKEPPAELINRCLLIPDETGKLSIYRGFWKEDDWQDDVVPPLLVYADLVNEGSAEDMELAREINERYLQH